MGAAQETARLFARYGEELYRFCLGRLRSPEEAEDAVQNTFIRVFRALEGGTQPEFEAAWLYRIATNVCLSRQGLTSRRSQWVSTQDVDRLQVAAPERDPETTLELVDAVSAMPKNLRDAILLREWRGLSYAEIADSLDTSIPAVETLIVRARRHLVTALRPFRRAGLVDGALLYRLRALLAGAGPAPVAAGAAALALGGAVVGADVGHADSRPIVQTTSAPARHVAAVPTTRAATVAHVRRRAAHPRTVARPTRRTPAAASTRSALRTVAPVLRVPEPAAETTPTTTAAAPAPAAPAPTATTAPAPHHAAPKPPPTTTTIPLAALAPPLPLPTLPAPLPLPAPPAVSVPTVTAPAVTVPSVTVPSVGVTTPTITLP